jgi:hypothetical protein
LIQTVLPFQSVKVGVAIVWWSTHCFIQRKSPRMTTSLQWFIIKRVCNQNQQQSDRQNGDCEMANREHVPLLEGNALDSSKPVEAVNELEKLLKQLWSPDATTDNLDRDIFKDISGRLIISDKHLMRVDQLSRAMDEVMCVHTGNHFQSDRTTLLLCDREMHVQCC